MSLRHLSTVRGAKAPRTPARVVGVVASKEGEVLLVRPAAKRTEGEGAPWHRARLAPGCLLEPECGDLVVVLFDGERVLVTDVLERRGDEASKVTVLADACLEVGGALELFGADGVVFASEAGTSVVASTARLELAEGRVEVERAGLVSREALIQTEEAHLYAETHDSAVGRAVEHFFAVTRRILGVDRIRAREYDARAKETLSLRGHASKLTAEGPVTTHGGPIQFG